MNSATSELGSFSDTLPVAQKLSPIFAARHDEAIEDAIKAAFKYVVVTEARITPSVGIPRPAPFTPELVIRACVAFR